MAPERARSQPPPSLDLCLALGDDAVLSLEQLAAGGAPAGACAAQSPTGEHADTSAAAEATATPPPVVHVPWQAKPLAHALSTGADPSPLASPRKPHLQAAPAAASSWDSGRFASGASSLGSGGLGSAAAGPAAPPAGAAGGNGQKREGCAGSAGGSLPAARPTRTAGQQRWDLSFCSAALEAQFRCAGGGEAFPGP